jgi:hypothetical protein
MILGHVSDLGPTLRGSLPEIDWISREVILKVGNKYTKFSLGGTDKEAGGFGLSLHQIITPSQGQGGIDNPADNHESENDIEDVDLKLGSSTDTNINHTSYSVNKPKEDNSLYNTCKQTEMERDADVEPPYSGFPGPIPVDEDADKKYNIVRGAQVYRKYKRKQESDKVSMPVDTDVYGLEAAILPDGTINTDENRHTDYLGRGDVSIPRNPEKEGPIYGR